jgi:hypothetical protein
MQKIALTLNSLGHYGGGIGIGVDGYVTSSCLEYFLIEQGVDLPANIRKTKRIKDAPIIPKVVTANEKHRYGVRYELISVVVSEKISHAKFGYEIRYESHRTSYRNGFSPQSLSMSA